jgi:hypothetical protein
MEWSELPTTTATWPSDVLCSPDELLVYSGLEAAVGRPGNSAGVRLAHGADAWAPINPEGAPARRTEHSALLAGRDLWVWGGLAIEGRAALPDGARYSPSSDSWSPIATAGAPSPRHLQGACWTGTEVMVWGGQGETALPLDTGEAYDPNANTWRSLPPINGLIKPRAAPDLFWTGKSLLVYQGVGKADKTGRRKPIFDGALLDTTTNEWRPMNPTGAPGPGTSKHHTCLIGKDLVVWRHGNIKPVRDPWFAAIYDTEADQWRPLSFRDAPHLHRPQLACGTDRELVVWGRYPEEGKDTWIYRAGVFDLATDTWRTLPGGWTVRGDMDRVRALWDGSSLILWGARRGERDPFQGSRLRWQQEA